MEKDYHNLPIKFTSFIFQQVSVRSHLATMTWMFHVVSLTLMSSEMGYMVTDVTVHT